MVPKESDGSTPRSNCSEEDEEEDGSSPECGIPMTTFLTPPEEQNGKWNTGMDVQQGPDNRRAPGCVNVASKLRQKW